MRRFCFLLAFAMCVPASLLSQEPAKGGSRFIVDFESGDISAGDPGETRPPPAKTPVLPQNTAGMDQPADAAQDSAPSAPGTSTAGSDGEIEKPAGAPTPAPTAARRVNPREELFLLETAMAESSFRVNANPDNRDALVTAYEKVIGFYCMPEMYATLVYQGPPEDPRCQEYIQKVLSVDPDNAMAVCARDGIDAISCLDAFAMQEVRTFSGSDAKGSVAATRMEAELGLARNQKKLETLSAELSTAMDNWRSKSDEDSLDTVKSIYSSLLQLSCAVSMIRLVPISEQEKKELMRKKSGQAAKPRDSLEEAVLQMHQALSQPDSDNDSSQKRPAGQEGDDIISRKTAEQKRKDGTPGLPDTPVKRVREVSGYCQDRARAALGEIPLLPSAVCNLDGFFSPSCVQALRRAREEALLRRQRRAHEKAGEQGSAHAYPTPVKDSLASF